MKHFNFVIFLHLKINHPVHQRHQSKGRNHRRMNSIAPKDLFWQFGLRFAVRDRQELLFQHEPFLVGVSIHREIRIAVSFFIFKGTLGTCCVGRMVEISACNHWVFLRSWLGAIRIFLSSRRRLDDGFRPYWSIFLLERSVSLFFAYQQDLPAILGYSWFLLLYLLYVRYLLVFNP